ncbi:MAG: hypothetical protein ACRDV9_13920 [Acidimicrobiia bacterium]
MESAPQRREVGEPDNAALHGAATMRDGVERLRALLVAAAEADVRASATPSPARVVGVIGTGIPNLGSAAGAGIAGAEVILVGSCDSIAILDLVRQRFQRVPKSMDLSGSDLTGEWRRFFRFELDPQAGAFTLALNEANTEVIRSWVHVDPCLHCQRGNPDPGTR